MRKLSTSETDLAVANPDTPTTTVSAGDTKMNDTPASASSQRTDDTPRGRPRRRGPAAAATKSQDSADRARRTSVGKEPATRSISEGHDNPSAEQTIESFDTV